MNIIGLCRSIKVFIFSFFSKKYKERRTTSAEISALKKLPRFTAGETSLLGQKLKFSDAASFLFLYNELFNQEIYKFETDNPTPFILDCGANIGLSIIYFKKLFPHARIVGFEPDKRIFELLKHNVAAMRFSEVSLINSACWNEVTTLQFFSEGADGGRAAKATDENDVTEVTTVRLRECLKTKIDFLKIDIEGAELVVLEDCKDLLVNVEKLFVEYHSFTGEEQQLDKLLMILKDAGFRYSIQQHGVVSFTPFIKIITQSGMDILLNIAAYRTNKTNSI